MSVTDASLTDAPDAGEELRGLFYPHGRFVPREGSLFEVAGGVFWLRMPLPMALNHINLWVLEDEDGWAIVDTGLNMPDVVAHWRALLDGPLGGRPVRRVIVTHYHPDHIGLAGWLCRKFQVPLEITREEYLLARTLTLDTPAEVPPEVIEFYRRAGWPDEAMAIFNGGGWGNFGARCRGCQAGISGCARARCCASAGATGASSMATATAPSMPASSAMPTG